LSGSTKIELLAPAAFPLVQPGDDLARLVVEAMEGSGTTLASGDVVVVAQKIVSKAENRIVDLRAVRPSGEALALAAETGKDPRLVQVILGESTRVVRRRKGSMIMEHRLGFVMAHAGVDHSNVAPGAGDDFVLLLPEDPDASAERLRRSIAARTGAAVAVVINDSFGRPWRHGTVGVAIGAAGLPSLVDRRGHPDMFGRALQVTVIGFADEVAAAASLLMGQADEGRPVVVVRGLSWTAPACPVAATIRPAAEDMFR
jgi:coenzyme F420-0:L-glutamate ligase / coenzyme F420-1:gamma-L-glutamate ligase